jgi:hypothetical protein
MLLMKIQGTQVKDATKPIILTITKDDVRSGAKKNSNSCAAANALCRQEGCEAAKVHMARAYIKKGKTWYRFAVPAPLRNEVLAFDRGGTFEPGEYILTPVQPSIRLGKPHSSTPDLRTYAERKGKPSKNKRKRAYHVVSGVRARMVDEWWKEA